jgi:hypothetical protein
VRCLVLAICRFTNKSSYHHLVRQHSAANLHVTLQLYSQMLAPPQSLQVLIWRLCWQMLVPPQSLHLLLRRLCSQMLPPPQSLKVLLMRLCWQMPAPHLLLWQLFSHFRRPLCCALSCRIPLSPPPPAPPCSSASSACCPRRVVVILLTSSSTRGTCPAASRARTCPALPLLHYWPLPR